MSQPRRTLVPGRIFIDEDHAAAMAGYTVHYSYMDDPTEIEEEKTFLDDTIERKMRKEGKTDIEIMLVRKQITQNRLEQAHRNLEKGMRGARDFEELINKYDEEHTFAVPNAPADVTRAKLLSSTPKNPNHTSRSFRCLDISQVVNTEISLLNVSNPPIVSLSNENNVEKEKEQEEAENSIQNTFTKEKCQSDGPLQGTYMKNQTSEEGSIQGTFTKEKEQISQNVQGTFTKEQNKDDSIQGTFTKEKDSSGSTLQGTFVRENSAEGSETSGDKNTFVVDAAVPNAENTFTVPTNIEIPSKQTKKAQREKRNISIANSMLESSMLNVVDSPGAQHFIRRPKKLRPSTDSQDKSRTIQMETINETNNGEQTGMSSYVDAMSEHDSEQFEGVRQITPIVEISKPTDIVTNVDNSRKTPTRNYLKPTFSSIQKSASKSNKPELADVAQVSTPTRVFTPIRSSSLSNRITQNIEENEEEEEDSVGATAVITQGEPVDFSNLQSSSNEQASIYRIERTLDVLNLQDPVGRLSFDDDNDGLDNDGDVDEEMNVSSRSRTPQRMLESSLESVNTPGLFVKPKASRARRIYEENTTYNESLDARLSRSKHEEMVLAKRDLIKPEETNDDGLRRSTRTRVKPLRRWLGEQPVYEKSPMGSKRLVGVTEVVIKDKRMIKYKSADPTVILERQCAERAMKKERAEQRRRQLAEDHSRGINLDTTQEDIMTSEDEEDL